MFSKLTAVFTIVAAAGKFFVFLFGITRVAGRGCLIVILLSDRFSSMQTL